MHPHPPRVAWAVLASGLILTSTGLGQATTQPNSNVPTTSPSLTGLTPTTQPQEWEGSLRKVVVTSDLDEARNQIAPSLGAVTYTVGPTQIQNVPGGENASFQKVLLRTPGVVEDSFGQEHVRGDHGNLTYRVNGVLLPEPLNGFGQELDTRLIDSLTLIDGSLPAQFGFHTAGIVDVTTKSGATLNHNELSLYGGSYDTVQPSVQVGGSDGRLDYFVTTSYNHNGIGIENPTGSHQPIHDYTDQEKIFGYFAYRLDDTSRITLLANASYADFEIPNTPNLTPAFTLAGAPPGVSSQIDENQNEQEYYTVLSYLKSIDKASLQMSSFSRYGQIKFDPNPVRDLQFQGVSSKINNNFVTNGVQFDSSYIVSDDHTVRTGLIADYTSEKLDTTTGVFPTDINGTPTSATPFDITDNTGNHATESGAYLQDEWRLTPKLTMNYGARYDRFDSNFDTEDQLSPRINLVYKVDPSTTVHAGYSRYFVPPPVQNVTSATIQKFAGTTNAPGNFLADPPKVERSNYFDAGISHHISDAWQVGFDGFYKQAHNLVDLGQFGAALIETPINYKTANVYGAEISSTYTAGGFSAFGNIGWVETRAHDIDSQQFQISNDELAFISDHDIKLDHQAEFAGSFGVAYQWTSDRVYLDVLAATGLRTGFANTGEVQAHYPVNVGYEHIFRPKGMTGNSVRLRTDIVNLFDEKYQIRDGDGIGVGAPQYGQRIGIYAGLTYEF